MMGAAGCARRALAYRAPWIRISDSGLGPSGFDPSRIWLAKPADSTQVGCRVWAHPAEYEKRKAEAHVFGEGNPSPVVVTFTTELACMAANEMLNQINRFRGAPMKNLVRKFHLMEDFKPGAKAPPPAYFNN